MDSYYDDIAEGYEELHRDEQLRKATIIKEHISVTKSLSLLDVGCGAGFYLHLFKCKVMGVDPSKKLLEKNKYSHILASAEHLPFPNDSFDVVISITAIHNFSDIKQGLLEIRRVGKSFALSVLKNSPKWEGIDDLIKTLFVVKTIVMESKDIIYFCEKL